MRPILILLAAAALIGCTTRKVAIDALGNALGEAVSRGGTTYSRDDDPELIGQAAPTALKTIEGIIDESPTHRGLLLTAVSGFTQYSYAYVQCEADYVEDRDLARATELRERARNLYRRAMGYGIRGIETDHPGFMDQLRSHPDTAIAALKKRDIPLLYWTANAWGGLISLSKENPDLMVELPLAGALMRRALELDPGFGQGSLHDFFIAYEGGRPAAAGGSADRARRHLEEALRLSRGRRAAPLLIFAETVLVAEQNRTEFERVLREVLAIDPNRNTEHRLANLIAQKRARWLLGRMNELFVE